MGDADQRLTRGGPEDPEGAPRSTESGIPVEVVYGPEALDGFDPAAALGIMQRDKVTIFAGVPTMYWALLNTPEFVFKD